MYLATFWRRTPALLYGLATLIGFYASLNNHIIVLIPVLFLIISLIFSLLKGEAGATKQLLLCLLVGLCTWVYGLIYYTFPQVPEQGIRGWAYIEIQSLSENSSFMGKSWHYKCHAKTFFSENWNVMGRHFNCSLSLPQKEDIKHPEANQSYLVSGKLLISERGQY